MAANTGNKNGNKSPEQYIREQISKTPEGGKIILDDVCVQFPGLDRRHLIAAMRNVAFNYRGRGKAGFITGRRGQKTRLVYGNALETETARPTVESQTQGGKPQETPAPALTGGNTTVDVEVELPGGQKMTVPARVLGVVGQAH